MVHKDCFAYKDRNGQDRCTALREMKCDGCVFYKPAETADGKPKRKIGESSILGRPANISDKTKDEIANMRRDGIKVKIIASEMGVSVPTVYRILQDRLSEEEMRKVKYEK